METTQYTTPDGATITTIVIEHQCFHPERAQKFYSAINGKSYMNFQVILAPTVGGKCVSVQTDYDGSKAEIEGMLVHLMFNELTK